MGHGDAVICNDQVKGTPMAGADLMECRGSHRRSGQSKERKVRSENGRPHGVESLRRTGVGANVELSPSRTHGVEPGATADSHEEGWGLTWGAGGERPRSGREARRPPRPGPQVPGDWERNRLHF